MSSPFLIVASFGRKGLDAVILNAGILRSMSLGNLDAAAIREQFEVNALALLLLQALPPLMILDQLALMTSRMGSIEDNSSGGTMAIECRRWP